MNQLLSFYLGGKNSQNRTLEEILDWPDSEWEAIHDYIQWVFPLIEQSQFNLTAPVLDEETISVFKSNPKLQQRLILSSKRYVDFLNRNPGIWVRSMDHNHLRITRMLRSLMILGCEVEAKRIFANLERVAESSNINETSLEFWREAIKDDLE